METQPAGVTQCFTCDFWTGERRHEPAGHVTFEGRLKTAACANPASTTHRTQMAPHAMCNHWKRWQAL